jgi:hypothetical protein
VDKVPEYLTLEEAAAQLGVDPDELRRAGERGDITVLRAMGVWIVSKAQVARYIDEHATDANGRRTIMEG